MTRLMFGSSARIMARGFLLSIPGGMRTSMNATAKRRPFSSESLIASTASRPWLKCAPKSMMSLAGAVRRGIVVVAEQKFGRHRVQG